MRTVKDAQDRKNEILDTANELFAKQGFDGTSISNILDKVGIARGTLYYHFKSKEDIMDALIKRTTDEIVIRAQNLAKDKKIPIIERILGVVTTLNISDEEEGKVMIEEIHKPQNALMHQKMQKAIRTGITPIMAGMVAEGVEDKLFETPFPYESMEMVMIYAITVFDDEESALSAQEYMTCIQAFIFNMERLLGAKPGSFMEMFQVIAGESSGHNE